MKIKFDTPKQITAPLVIAERIYDVITISLLFFKRSGWHLYFSARLPNQATL